MTLRHTIARYIQREGIARLGELHASERLSPENFAREQQRRLADYLRGIAERVPYYRELLNLDRLLTDDGVDMDEFRKLPVLDKDAMRGNWTQMTSDQPDATRFENFSGGSSGEPLRFIQDAYYRGYNLAGAMLFDKWGGIQPGDCRVKLWGSLRDMHGSHSGIKSRISHWAMNTHFFNPFHFFGEKELLELFHQVKQLRPAQIIGYTECVTDLARMASKQGGLGYMPRNVLTTASTLTDEMRGLIEEGLKVKVTNRYGSREVGGIACTCERNEGMHILGHTHFVEVVDAKDQPVPPGVSGHLLITCLTNYSMPFLRYRIGDMATWSEEPCSCGRGWPTLATVDGRDIDYFFTAEGQHVYPGLFHAVFYYRDWVKRFQAIQEELDAIEILVQPWPGSGMSDEQVAAELEDIRVKILAEWGGHASVKVRLVDHIEAGPSGKFHHLVCKVKPHPRLGHGQ